MSELESLIKVLVGLLIVYVIAKVGLAIIGLFGFLSSISDYINSIPYLNTLILILFAIVAGYYVFFKQS